MLHLARIYQAGAKIRRHAWFLSGAPHVSDERRILDRENRKIITTLTFHDIQEINPDIIEELIEEAIFIDHETARMKGKNSSHKRK